MQVAWSHCISAYEILEKGVSRAVWWHDFQECVVSLFFLHGEAAIDTALPVMVSIIPTTVTVGYQDHGAHAQKPGLVPMRTGDPPQEQHRGGGGCGSGAATDQ